MALDKQYVIDFLRRLGYTKEAEDAAKTLPDSISRAQILEFVDRHDLPRDELIDRIGGSP